MANCKPNQLAWIRVPGKDAQSGVEALHGRVVTTVRPLPHPWHGMAQRMWVISPMQKVSFMKNGRDAWGASVRAGDVLTVEALPEAWLVPFDPDSKPADKPELLALPVVEQTL